MCGIAGIMELAGAPVDSARLGRMTDSLVHRGPDGHGLEIRGAVGLGHRRLKIVDLSDASAQPMSIADNSLWLSYNGEIHNYIELRAELEDCGIQFRTTGDTEVVLWAWKTWGSDCFEKFNGMWAMAIWDVAAQCLTLSRDRFGIKPLYYAESEERLVFASECKAILAGFPELRIPDTDTIREYLNGASPHASPATFIRPLRSVPAGTLLQIRDKKIHRQRYWSFQPGEEEPVADSEEQFRTLLDDSVRLRLRTDARLGSALSGGLDSATVVRLAGPRKPGLSCFSLRNREPQLDESRYAAMAADDAERYRLHWIDPGPVQLAEIAPALCWHHDGPPMLRGTIPQWLVEQSVHASGVKVLLDGQGSDELLGGYELFALPYLLDRIRLRQHHPEPFSWKGLWQEARDLAQVDSRNNSVLDVLIKRNLKHWLRPGTTRTAEFAGPSLDTGKGRTSQHYRRSWIHSSSRRPYRSHLNNALWQELRGAGLPEVLHAEDAMTMAFSIESRLPFLDHRLVEFCFRLPYHEKIRDGWTKSLLRRSTQGVLPEEIRWRRRKLGFPGPHGKWLGQTNSQEFLRDVLGSRRCRQRGLLNPRGLDKLLARSPKQLRAYLGTGVETVWKLIMVEVFCQLMIDGDGFVDGAASRIQATSG